MRNKTILLAFTILLFFTSGVSAQKKNDKQTVRVRNFELLQKREQIAIDFTLDIGKKAAKRNNTFTVIPVLSNGDVSMELTPVVVRGRKAKTLYKRRFIASPRTAGEIGSPDVIVADNGQSIQYHTVIPYSDWMSGSVFSFDGVDEGCCSAIRTNLGILSGQLIYPETAFVVEEEILIPAPVLTTGDKLAQIFPFIRPAGDEKFSREGITVYFRQGKHYIERDYRQNDDALLKILSAIREITDSGDSLVERVVIAGFASPEGSYQLNLQLSERRAEQIRQFIYDNSTLQSDKFSLHIGGEDWEGLREMVAASDMKDKQAVLDIIDHVPVWDSREGRGREGELMRLHGGEPYRYMYRNFYPELRNAAYITVYYKNK